MSLTWYWPSSLVGSHEARYRDAKALQSQVDNELIIPPSVSNYRESNDVLLHCFNLPLKMKPSTDRIIYASNHGVIYNIGISIGMTRGFQKSAGPFIRPFWTLIKICTFQPFIINSRIIIRIPGARIWRLLQGTD